MMTTKYDSNSFFKNAINFLFPHLCFLCDEPLKDNQDWLCDSCIAKLTHNANSRNACSRCAQNLDLHSCDCNIVWDNPFSRIYSLFDFDDTIRSIAHNIKYSGKSKLAFFIGESFADLISKELFANVDFIIPVPLNIKRLKKRGYNQSDFFAGGIIKGLGTSITYIDDAIVRIKNTKTQTKLDKAQRLKNLNGAFILNSKYVNKFKNKIILIVDDIVTTGATTGACANILLKAGAMDVRVLSLARD